MTENQNKKLRKVAALHRHSVMAQEIGNFTDALRKVDQALHLLPDDEQFLAMRALILFDMSKFKEAHISAIKSIMINPGGSHAWLVFGYLAEQNNEYEAASLYYERMTKIDPAVHNFTLLAAMEMQFDKEKAKKSILNALEIDETWEEAIKIAIKLKIYEKNS